MKRQRVYSLLVIFFMGVCVALFIMLFISSIRYESNRSKFNAKYFNDNQFTEIELKPEDGLGFISNPLESELYLRSMLLNDNKSKAIADDVVGSYKNLLRTRPAWPYLYSGLMQAQQLSKGEVDDSLELAIKYGIHERDIIASVAEYLFTNWNSVDRMSRSRVLDYLNGQTETSLTAIISMASKFGRVYDYCDYYYMKTRKINDTCKRHYWQPLIDV